jgi:hypothetical protein
MIAWVHLRVLVPRAGRPDYRLPAAWALLRTAAHGLGANYTNDWLAWVPIALFPVILLHLSTARQSAIGYIVLTAALSCGTIPIAFVTAEFARRSGQGDAHSGLPASALVPILGLSVMVSLGGILSAPLLLSLFGGLYRHGGLVPLQILLASVVPTTGRALFVAHCRLHGWRWQMVGAGIISAALLVALITFGATGLGLAGAAVGWTAGQWLAAALSLLVWRGRGKARTPAAALSAPTSLAEAR